MVELNNKEIRDLKEKELNYNSIEDFVNHILEYFEIEKFKLFETYDYYEKESIYNFGLITKKEFKYNYNLNIYYSRRLKALKLICSEIEKPITENDKNFIINRKVEFYNLNKYKLDYIIKFEMKRKNSKLVLENNKRILELLKSKLN